MNVSLRHLYHSEFIDSILERILPGIAIPLIAILLASIIGAVILMISGTNPFHAYIALFQGSLGSLESLSRTLEKTTPLMFSGLAIAFAFKSGLFNIGAQGQLLFGALVAAITGYSITGVSPFFHIPMALITGATAAALYGAIQGMLKAYTGAHEVITGIMLNYVAINITDYLSSGPFIDSSSGNIIARTPVILESARLSYIHFIPLGFVLAVICAFTLWWFFKHTVPGFVIQTVGTNIHAAKYAGINVQRTLVYTMLISGLLAGVGGAVETLGVTHRFQPGYNTGLGFEGITIALLGRTHPLGVIFSSFIFGAMKAGAPHMQFSTGVTTDVIDIIMALILFFVAADMMIRRIFRIKYSGRSARILTAGWGKP